MPYLGEIIRANKRFPERVYGPAAGLNKYIWHACVDCGKERWSALKYGKPKNLRCQKCGCGSKQPHGSANPAWKGGKQITEYGYISVLLEPSDIFYGMANNRGYVPEHRLIMAKYLGRCLLPHELIHHRGIHHPIGSKENKQDNCIENLSLIITGNKRGGWHTEEIQCPFCRAHFRVR